MLRHKVPHKNRERSVEWIASGAGLFLLPEQQNPRQARVGGSCGEEDRRSASPSAADRRLGATVSVAVCVPPWMDEEISDVVGGPTA
jgi:hypothetical protein